MRKLLQTFPIIIICCLASRVLAQMGCPGCIVSLPDSLPADTIFLTDAPEGRVGEAYEGDVSFRMPKTTTPVAAADSTVIPGITINEITIISVSNLPPGLTWEANQTVFKPAELTDGCVKFCGTPLHPGIYEVEVVVSARILVINQTTSFSFPIIIEPAVSVTEGFTLENTSGCGQVSAHFVNNIPSLGREGFSYSWNFGNGRTTSDENPASQTYSEPGQYEVKYRAIIDTSAYVLTNVRLESFGCNDFFGGKPDIVLEVFDPAGTRIYQSTQIDNATAPLTYNINIPIGEGNYAIRVTDDDQGIEGGDDECGIINFNRLSNGNLQDVELTANITIFHKVDTVESVDTIVVFPQPTKPIVTGYENQSLCKGEKVKLVSSYENNIQWYRDSVPVIENGTETALNIDQSGDYWVQYTSSDGCQASSEPIALNFSPLPPTPLFLNDRNWLSLFDSTMIPMDYHAQWYLNGILLEGANGLAFCAPTNGAYRLEMMDNQTGCISSYSLNMTLNPNFAGCSFATSTEDHFDELVRDLKVYPNPTNGEVWLEFGLNQPTDATITIFNTLGQVISKTKRSNLFGEIRLDIDLRQQVAGMYFIEMQIENGRKNLKIIKE
ncbi:MAG: T9SS type A sorting domain-containing protein [Saprospiraceae bacterium]|nr:T9SS type A sorting domain-containing protein [Saprospiraceae bacterium]